LVRRALLSVVLISACGAPAPSSMPSTFIALQRDFEGFESWEAFAWDSAGMGGTHDPGAVTVYLKERPPAGATAFPVGTIIVKVTPPRDATTEEKIFAMAKRGGTFNANGAAGWEWFELKRSTSGAPVIVWRGVGAPAGERYGQTDASCNDCHGAAADNDSVHSPPLRVGELGQ
jgi:hypothetical protein